MPKVCKSCASDATVVTMSGANWEATEQRHERREKRLIVAVIVAIALMFASNICWLIYESQYETIDYSYAQDGNGNNIIGDSNEVDYIESAAENAGTAETQK